MPHGSWMSRHFCDVGRWVESTSLKGDRKNFIKLLNDFGKKLERGLEAQLTMRLEGYKSDRSVAWDNFYKDVKKPTFSLEQVASLIIDPQASAIPKDVIASFIAARKQYEAQVKQYFDDLQARYSNVIGRWAYINSGSEEEAAKVKGHFVNFYKVAKAQAKSLQKLSVKSTASDVTSPLHYLADACKIYYNNTRKYFYNTRKCPRGTNLEIGRIKDFAELCVEKELSFSKPAQVRKEK